MIDVVLMLQKMSELFGLAMRQSLPNRYGY